MGHQGMIVRHYTELPIAGLRNQSHKLPGPGETVLRPCYL